MSGGPPTGDDDTEPGSFDALLKRVAAPPTGAPRSALIGSRIGPYVIEAVLGSGGMGVVYRARDALLGRAAAVKLLPESIADDPERRARLLREARLAASIAHPHVATVFGCGEDDRGRIWIAMELLDGRTLRDRLKEVGPLAPGEIVRVGYAIATALAAAHEIGIVHRDLKPENVMVSRRGDAKVLDFGVARQIGPMAADALLTSDGVLVGTPAYMSPEQLHCEPVAAASDIFALGIVLYELASGARPFQPMSIFADDTGRSSTSRLGLHGKVSPELEAVVNACLMPRPADRPTASQVAETLRVCAAGGGHPRSASSPEAASTALRVIAQTNLPPRLSSFIGRVAEIGRVRDALVDSRLVTLVGIGGGGKTRLATEAARTGTVGSYRRVILVELAPLADPRLVAPTVAAALGLDEGDASRSTAERIVERLADEAVLLVLDNCEHLLEEAAALVTSLLRAPRLRVLATSREALRVEGERIEVVPPLGLPPKQSTKASDPDEQLQELLRNDAVRLFVERARERKPDLAIGHADYSALAAICMRLDGIPLALELAAARVSAFGVAQIAERLDDRFRLLTSGRREAMPRHQTLRALVDWSWELLDATARNVINGCGVFTGSFTLEAAEAVCSDDDVLDAIAQLVDKSLLVVEHAPDGARYRMLETFRAYALERLAATGLLDQMKARHGAFYLGVADRAQLRGPAGKVGIALLECDIDNLRAAVEWSLGPPERAAIPCVAASNIGLLAVFRGRPREGRAQMARILAASPAVGRTVYRAQVSIVLAILAYNLGDYQAALPVMEEALAIAREVGDAALVARAAQNLADLLIKSGNPARALEVLDGIQSHTTMNAAIASFYTGDVDRAEAILQDSLQHLEGVGDVEYRAEVAYYCGEIALVRGQPRRAAELLRKSFADAFAIQYPVVMLFALWGVVLVALASGELDRAARLLGAYEGRQNWHGVAPLPILVPRVGAVQETLRTGLGTAMMERAMREGSTWSWERIAQEIGETLS